MSHPVPSVGISPPPLTCYEEPEALMSAARPAPDPYCDQMPRAADGAEGAPADLPEDICAESEPEPPGPDCSAEILKTVATCGATALLLLEGRISVPVVLSGIGCVGQAMDTIDCLEGAPR